VLANVVTNASTAGAAAAENSRRVAAVIAKLREAGVAPAQITNGAYTIGQEFANGDRDKPRGFTARNMIRIEVSSVASVGKIIDASIAGGATEISPVQFTAPNLREAQADAMRLAVANMHRDAEILAEAAGGSLGRLLSITGASGSSAYRVLGGVALATSSLARVSEPTSLQPNDIVVNASASGRWEFIPRK
jgi:uncharacterized protein YggE